MFKATVNQKKEFDIELKGSSVLINGKEFPFEVLVRNQKPMVVKNGNHVFQVELVSLDGKTCHLKVNNRDYEVGIKEDIDLLLDKLGMSASDHSKVQKIDAPMPGMILEVKVEAGMEVSKDDPLMVLEAMKMENVLKSPGDGKVKQVRVRAGDSVEKKQVLIEFE